MLVAHLCPLFYLYVSLISHPKAGMVALSYLDCIFVVDLQPHRLQTTLHSFLLPTEHLARGRWKTGTHGGKEEILAGVSLWDRKMSLPTPEIIIISYFLADKYVHKSNPLNAQCPRGNQPRQYQDGFLEEE